MRATWAEAMLGLGWKVLSKPCLQGRTRGSTSTLPSEVAQAGKDEDFGLFKMATHHRGPKASNL